MTIPEDGYLLKIYIGVSRLHMAKIPRLSEDLPIVVEIVDGQEKIEAFMPLVDESIDEGLATLERVKVRFYRSGESPDPPSAPGPAS